MQFRINYQSSKTDDGRENWEIDMLSPFEKTSNWRGNWEIDMLSPI